MATKSCASKCTQMHPVAPNLTTQSTKSLISLNCIDHAVVRQFLHIELNERLSQDCPGWPVSGKLTHRIGPPSAKGIGFPKSSFLRLWEPLNASPTGSPELFIALMHPQGYLQEFFGLLISSAVYPVSIFLLDCVSKT